MERNFNAPFLSPTLDPMGVGWGRQLMALGISQSKRFPSVSHWSRSTRVFLVIHLRPGLRSQKGKPPPRGHLKLEKLRPREVPSIF